MIRQYTVYSSYLILNRRNNFSTFLYTDKNYRLLQQQKTQHVLNNYLILLRVQYLAEGRTFDRPRVDLTSKNTSLRSYPAAAACPDSFETQPFIHELHDFTA